MYLSVQYSQYQNSTTVGSLVLERNDGATVLSNNFSNAAFYLVLNSSIPLSVVSSEIDAMVNINMRNNAYIFANTADGTNQIVPTDFAGNLNFINTYHAGNINFYTSTGSPGSSALMESISMFFASSLPEMNGSNRMFLPPANTAKQA